MKVLTEKEGPILGLSAATSFYGGTQQLIEESAKLQMMTITTIQLNIYSVPGLLVDILYS